MHYRWLSPVILFSLLVEFTDIAMMRKCMLGIKRRVERVSGQTLEPTRATGRQGTGRSEPRQDEPMPQSV